MLGLVIAAAAGVAAFLVVRKAAPTPPAATSTTVTAAPATTLDFGLTPEEVKAVNTALAVENNPGNLKAFADTLSPMFPIAAGLLNAKAGHASMTG